MTGQLETGFDRSAITGAILAGGRGRRMGGADKGLVRLHGRPLVEHVIERLAPQVGRFVISANRNGDVYADYGFPVVADIVSGYRGPLAGMLSVLHAAATPFVLCVPCDAPVLPADLAARLATGLIEARADACVVSCDGRMQPVFALLRCTLAGHLQEYLRRGGCAVGAWLQQEGAVLVDFSDAIAAFANVNTEEDRKRLEEKRWTCGESQARFSSPGPAIFNPAAAAPRCAARSRRAP